MSENFKKRINMKIRLTDRLAIWQGFSVCGIFRIWPEQSLVYVLISNQLGAYICSYLDCLSQQNRCSTRDNMVISSHRAWCRTIFLVRRASMTVMAYCRFLVFLAICKRLVPHLWHYASYFSWVLNHWRLPSEICHQRISIFHTFWLLPWMSMVTRKVVI